MSSSFHLAVLALAACLIAYAVVTLRRLDDLELQMMRLLADVAAELAATATDGAGGASFLASASSSGADSGGCPSQE